MARRTGKPVEISSEESINSSGKETVKISDMLSSSSFTTIVPKKQKKKISKFAEPLFQLDISLELLLFNTPSGKAYSSTKIVEMFINYAIKNKMITEK